jgi:hypothetical protein
MMDTPALHIAPPLPCAVRTPTETDPERRCGRPASVAQAERLPTGAYTILPICRACVEATARVYGLTDEPPAPAARAARPGLVGDARLWTHTGDHDA